MKILFSLLACVHAATITLDDTSFNHTLVNSPYILAIFCAEHSFKCPEILPQFRKASELLNNVVVAEIDEN